MQYNQLHNPSTLASQKDDTKKAIEVLLQSKQDVNCEWGEEILDTAAKMLKEKEAMHR